MKRRARGQRYVCRRCGHQAARTEVSHSVESGCHSHTTIGFGRYHVQIYSPVLAATQRPGRTCDRAGILFAQFFVHNDLARASTHGTLSQYAFATGRIRGSTLRSQYFLHDGLSTLRSRLLSVAASIWTILAWRDIHKSLWSSRCSLDRH